VRAEF